VRIAILVKQIPAGEEMALGADGRLLRDGVAREMNAYCRRAVAQGVALARETGGSTTVFTLGPPHAIDVLREAVAFGADAGVLVTDSRFAGSDTVATTAALAAALEREGPFSCVLVGRNSLDAETGQVGPGVAELLGWGFLPSVRQLTIDGTAVTALCEEDDGESERSGTLPLVIATAERLIEPCKVPTERWVAAHDSRLSLVDAAALGSGAWGADGSPTSVGEVRIHTPERARILLEGTPEASAARAIHLLEARGAFAPTAEVAHDQVRTLDSGGDLRIGVVLEPDRPSLARELLGEANAIAGEAGGTVVAITVGAIEPELLSAWGADDIESISGEGLAERDVAAAVVGLLETTTYWSLLLPSTAWGREVAGRVSARARAGLTGDALELEIETTPGGPRLVAWKSALGGQLLVAIRASSDPQMATVRPGAVRLRAPRPSAPLTVQERAVHPVGGVVVGAIRRNDDVEELERATRVIGVGAGVPPDGYDVIEQLAKVLDATIAGTRRVTDKGWLPRARQIGITGRSIRPHLYVAIGISGKFNHTVGVRSATTILAINSDPDAPIFGVADIGIVGEWELIVPLLTAGVPTPGGLG
jgi:electron transfer flavoprotein alpha subunit